jgi:hypothetical protein
MIDEDDPEVEIDERRCPFCGHPETRWEECDAIGCEDGDIDLADEDPINYSPGAEFYTCLECHGQGHIHWCPSCGKDILDGIDRNPDECPNCGGDGVPQGDGVSYICQECGCPWRVDMEKEE